MFGVMAEEYPGSQEVLPRVVAILWRLDAEAVAKFTERFLKPGARIHDEVLMFPEEDHKGQGVVGRLIVGRIAEDPGLGGLVFTQCTVTLDSQNSLRLGVLSTESPSVDLASASETVLAQVEEDLRIAGAALTIQRSET